MAKNSKIGAELAELLLLKTSFYTWFDLKPKENTDNDVIKQIFLFCNGFCAGRPVLWGRIITAQPSLQELWAYVAHTLRWTNFLIITKEKWPQQDKQGGMIDLFKIIVISIGT